MRAIKPRSAVLLPIVALIAVTGSQLSENKPSSSPLPQPGQVLIQPTYPYRLAAQSTLSQSLLSAGLSHSDIQAIVESAKPFRNLNRLRPGIRYRLDQSEAMPHAQPLSLVEFEFSPTEYLRIEKNPQGLWQSQSITKKINVTETGFLGEVKTSLWESALDAGMDPKLISELAEIFAWQIDFAREVQNGDRWRLTVEQQFVDGEFIGYGRIIAAEYLNSKVLHQAVYYSGGQAEAGYYALDGSSMKRIFLKSPIQFGRITSRYTGKRFHPILKEYKAHRGVDYAAPAGTPIMTVGGGRVTFAGFQSSAGNTVKIQHTQFYSTAYKHLRGFAPGVRNGTRVEQGQIIGYVGSTGLSTGPHLHFEFYENGRYIDPLNKKFPAARPIPADEILPFQVQANTRLALLPNWDRLLIALRQDDEKSENSVERQ